MGHTPVYRNKLWQDELRASLVPLPDPPWERVRVLSEADFQELVRRCAEAGWDAAVASMRHEDGSPVKRVTNDNPYRKETI